MASLHCASPSDVIMLLTQHWKLCVFAFLFIFWNIFFDFLFSQLFDITKRKGPRRWKSTKRWNLCHIESDSKEARWAFRKIESITAIFTLISKFLVLQVFYERKKEKKNHRKSDEKSTTPKKRGEVRKTKLKSVSLSKIHVATNNERRDRDWMKAGK